MSKAFTYTLKRSCFDENYNPSENTRTTTNFANLARGEKRQENLRNTLVMINNRFNALARWDNPNADRYAVELEIISVDLNIGAEKPFPAIEILQTTIVDNKNSVSRQPTAVWRRFPVRLPTVAGAEPEPRLSGKRNPEGA